MRVLRYFILSLLLISPVAAQDKSLRGQSNSPAPNIEFTIQTAGWAKSRESYPAGESIHIRCVWKNKGKGAATFLLADHDSYQGTLPYPVGMKAKVTYPNHVVLTDTPTFGEWWSSYILTSSMFTEMPGDRVTLKPNEEVVRIVPLDEVLRGIDGLEKGLPEGDYAVELKLGDIVSNRLWIKIKADK